MRVGSLGSDAIWSVGRGNVKTGRVCGVGIVGGVRRRLLGGHLEMTWRNSFENGIFFDFEAIDTILRSHER